MNNNKIILKFQTLIMKQKNQKKYNNHKKSKNKDFFQIYKYNYKKSKKKEMYLTKKYTKNQLKIQLILNQ